MSFGIVMLVHEPLARAVQVARHWAAAGCPIVVHVDKQVGTSAYKLFTSELADYADIRFCARHRCEWGTWSLVAASQTASQKMLDEFPDVRHVYLASGSCLPLRPVSELRDYLLAHPRTNFIESVTTKDVSWTIGGLDSERFTFSFPFSWKHQRVLFDAYVAVQRMFGMRRRLPDGLVPHLGSQWWCLTRQTLSAILDDPNRKLYETYFRRVWIPDESYYQSLVRLYSDAVESRSLTLSKFDFQGKPHIFYNDHLQLLRRSDCFVARKIWPNADRLYESFLSDPTTTENRAEPSPGKIDRVFAKAVDKRTRGRAGLYMQSRYPNWDWENGKTAAPYSVFGGFDHLLEDFGTWLGRSTGARTHGHLFAPERAEFADHQKVFAGGLSDSAELRDYGPQAFLTNLIWNTRGERQVIQFGPRDNQKIAPFLVADPNAQIAVVSGAWAIPLFHSNKNFGEIREVAAKLQRVEAEFLDLLRSPQTKARVRIWTMAEFVEQPMEPLQTVIEEMGARAGHRLTEAPRMANLEGFGQFLQNLKNQGMHPHLMGDFPVSFDGGPGDTSGQRPYLVR